MYTNLTGYEIVKPYNGLDTTKYNLKVRNSVFYAVKNCLLVTVSNRIKGICITACNICIFYYTNVCVSWMGNIKSLLK
jgi:hypothetical protein